MQLKTVGETSNAFNAIQNVMGNPALEARAQHAILRSSLQGYSADTVKAAIAQSTLNESQIKTVLSAKKFKGELLNTTAAELAQTTQTNALNRHYQQPWHSIPGVGRQNRNQHRRPRSVSRSRCRCCRRSRCIQRI